MCYDVSCDVSAQSSNVSLCQRVHGTDAGKASCRAARPRARPRADGAGRSRPEPPGSLAATGSSGRPPQRCPSAAATPWPGERMGRERARRDPRGTRTPAACEERGSCVRALARSPEAETALHSLIWCSEAVLPMSPSLEECSLVLQAPA